MRKTWWDFFLPTWASCWERGRCKSPSKKVHFPFFENQQKFRAWQKHHSGPWGMWRLALAPSGVSHE